MIYQSLQNLQNYKLIRSRIRDKKNIAAFGVSQNQKPYVTAGIDGFIVYIAADFVQAQETLAQLNSLKGGYAYLPPKDEVLVSNKGSSVASRAQNGAALYGMTHGLNGIVTTVESLCQRYPYADSFFAGVIKISKGDAADVFDVVERLVAAGYRRSESITAMGEFSRRGDILDVFCPSYENPVRIEFFGDEIEDVRVFDKMTKKSLNKIPCAIITPINRFFSQDFDADILKETVFAATIRQKLSPDDKARLNAVVEDVFTAADNGDFSNGWLLPFVKNSVFVDYLPQNAVIVWDEPKQLADKIKSVYDEHYQRLAYLLSKGEVLPQAKDQLIERNAVLGLLSKYPQLAFQNLSSSNSLFFTSETVGFKSSPITAYQNKTGMLCDDVRSWTTNGYSVLMCAGSDEAAKRLQNEMQSNGLLVGIRQDDELPKQGAAICSAAVTRGFIDHDEKLALLGCFDLFPKNVSKQKIRKSNDKIFTTPDVGDYVVHDVHGIGLCQGIVTMEGNLGIKDYIVVKYKNDDTLYVPVDSSNLLTRYSGSEKAPRLSRLGGNDFEKIKSKVKSTLKEMAFDLLKLYAARENSRGFSYPADSYLEEEFAKAFPYNETVDQIKCIQDVKNDLESTKIMDRLICGDVGYGKTEVALRAAFKVMAAGKQVAFLSPTTILAEQHYKTTMGRMKDFGFDVRCLNRFRSEREQKTIISDLASGKAEMVCGTHRLLSKDVVFKDLGLLILDEEQRFGVEAKESLKNIKNNVDVLTLSATPIPRTLHMALTGMRDISIIQSPPKDRLPVETYVTEGTDTILSNVIMREVNRGGQVFLIYNRVETIDRFAGKLRELMPSVRFIVAHGQMRENDLEKNIYDFTAGQYDVLISSTIIENGIDIPNANTLIVYDADNFGLSQLYQLRGRVGRSNRRAFAYFMYRENKVLTDVAYTRLSSVLEYTELGSGFKIAMRDLEIRGAGNVLGREQHGHMEKVGYDMYCKLLAESVDELKGKKTQAAIETSLDVAINATSGNYIDDAESRMAFYQRLAAISSQQDAEALLDEITDIYGTPPSEVLNLIDLSLLKQKASSIGISEITVRKGNVSLCFFNKDYLQTEGVFEALQKYKNVARLDVTHKLSVVFECGNESVEKSFDKILSFVDIAASKKS